ncbi:hypothetical protein [Roseovarius litoreus]|uniref:hypothetical protein n=1 Tax=Roseovarius litoreus TaxID=1155722 RepID=UPI00122C9F6D|nr:hypothetical protein [Roseovarius litoreus]
MAIFSFAFLYCETGTLAGSQGHTDQPQGSVALNPVNTSRLRDRRRTLPFCTPGICDITTQ